MPLIPFCYNNVRSKPKLINNIHNIQENTLKALSVRQYTIQVLPISGHGQNKHGKRQSEPKPCI